MHSCSFPTRGQRTPPPGKLRATSSANRVSSAKLEFQTDVFPRAAELPVSPQRLPTECYRKASLEVRIRPVASATFR